MICNSNSVLDHLCKLCVQESIDRTILWAGSDCWMVGAIQDCNAIQRMSFNWNETFPDSLWKPSEPRDICMKFWRIVKLLSEPWKQKSTFLLQNNICLKFVLDSKD